MTRPANYREALLLEQRLHALCIEQEWPPEAWPPVSGLLRRLRYCDDNDPQAEELREQLTALEADQTALATTELTADDLPDLINIFHRVRHGRPKQNQPRS